MFREHAGRDCVLEAMREAAEASGGEAEAEVLLRVSRGVAVRHARGAPSEASSWIEETVAVRVLLPSGSEALVAMASWDDAAEAARRAVALAALMDADGEPPDEPRLQAPRCVAPQAAFAVPRDPQDEAALLHALAEVERAALEQDERIVAVDAALARSAVVESYLANTSGLALHQRHATAAAHAAAIVRDGMQVAVRGEAWAGPSFTPAEAARLGRRLGIAGLAHLIGSGAAPPSPPAVLLSSWALAEMTTAFVPALLGMGSLGHAGASGLPAALALREDSALDATSRALPVDGAGRLLRVVSVIENGAWTPPGAAMLPRVRPGSGDAPRPGILRLTWSWDGGVPEDELLGAMGTGLWIETAHAIQTDPATFTWRGAVAGFWVEDGRRRHAVSGVPFSANLLDLLRGATCGGNAPETAHPSGTIRAVPLIVNLTRAR